MHTSSQTKGENNEDFFTLFFFFFSVHGWKGCWVADLEEKTEKPDNIFNWKVCFGRKMSSCAQIWDGKEISELLCKCSNKGGVILWSEFNEVTSLQISKRTTSIFNLSFYNAYQYGYFSWIFLFQVRKFHGTPEKLCYK